MISNLRRLPILILVLCLLKTSLLLAADSASTMKALRISAMITGGTLPTSDPLFTQMADRVQAGDTIGAAELAAKSRFFANYLARRLSFQMQNPSLDAEVVSDSDATSFLIAKFVGTAGAPASISSIWSEDATYLVNVTVNGVQSQVRAADLTAAQRASVNWLTDLVRVPGQQVKAIANGVVSTVPLPTRHVGGYVTLSDRGNDNSFAMYGANAGTNLRMVEGIWEIATGLTLMDFASSKSLAQDVPRFVPQYDPNFFQGQGQPACISCHGGGTASLNHGYRAVADVFDHTAQNGLVYIANPTNQTRKSLGSDPAKRNGVANCNLAATPTPVCNPDAPLVVDNSWNIGLIWSQTGMLEKMGWRGNLAGSGLNELGVALGRAAIVYQNLVKRVVREICPLGSFTKSEVESIAAAADPSATPRGDDDIRTIVARVASHASCL